MTERPILFSAPMVRALLDGTKTQTRRAVKPQFAADAEPAEMGATNEHGHQISGHSGVWWCDAEGNPEKSVRCPYGQPGDRLWVRETWQYYDWDEEGEPCIRYAADNATAWPIPSGEDWADRLVDVWERLSRHENYSIDNRARDRRWRPSIHMPRWASRILLEVTAVRVERLQDMEGQGAYPGESDALAEGVHRIHHGRGDYYYNAFRDEPNPKNWCDPTDAFRELWEQINGAGSWAANPWVWVVEFKRVQP